MKVRSTRVYALQMVAIALSVSALILWIWPGGRRLEPNVEQSVVVDSKREESRLDQQQTVPVVQQSTDVDQVVSESSKEVQTFLPTPIEHSGNSSPSLVDLESEISKWLADHEQEVVNVADLISASERSLHESADLVMLVDNRMLVTFKTWGIPEVSSDMIFSGDPAPERDFDDRSFDRMVDLYCQLAAVMNRVEKTYSMDTLVDAMSTPSLSPIDDELRSLKKSLSKDGGRVRMSTAPVSQESIQRIKRGSR